LREHEAPHSLFASLNDGNEALGARLRLIEAAQDTIDLQYFLMKPDLGGALVVLALLDAADRGVRIRLLLDDVFTTVPDRGLGLIDRHENLEVRIFNPAPRPGPKAFGFLTDFSRMNRRMHNKAFIADGAFAIIGGRNIADEYFQIQTTTEFADFEMLTIGRAVADIASAFDIFWNDGWSVPLSQMRPPPTADQLAAARTAFESEMRAARATYQKAVNDPYFTRLRSGEEPLFHGRATVISDPPSKLKTPVEAGERVLATALIDRLARAQRDVILLTPYFVPEDYGAELFTELAERDVRVRIVTNSLGSTNHAYVHAGYRRHRRPLLESGVELYEIRGDALQALGLAAADDEAGIVMHTKLAVIDGNETFVGSLNFDPRSIKLNTELGVFIESTSLAEALLTRLDRAIADYTYRLTLAPDGYLQWRYESTQNPSVRNLEPGATVWNNFLVDFTELLDVETQL
jgi:putative cardiolipin synthase